MKKYKIPNAFAVHIDSDPGLQQLVQNGQENNRPESEFYKAALAYTLDTRRNLLIELGRYIQQFGALEPMDYDTGANIEPTEAKTEVQEEEVYPKGEVTLKVLPPPTEQPRTKFSKPYSDDDQS
jgi:hypothetical protein